MTRKSNRIIISFLIFIFNIFILIFPRNMVGAARNGLNLWLTNVFPALFPFVFGVNILLGIGVISYIGKRLERIMSSFFGVPGAGGFAMVVGFTSGYPIGAKVVAELREREEITKTQAERLLSFCNNSGPLFILGTVGASMFSDIRLGYFVLIVHYISAIVTGFLFKYYKYNKDEKFNFKNKIKKQENRVTNFYAFFGDSIVKSVQTMLAIGGFIILFSVIIEIVKISRILENIETIFGQAFVGTIFGLIEVTNGASYLSQIGNINMQVAISTSVIVSFAGMSIHAQSINFISKTDINIKIYFIGKIIHALIAICIGIGMFRFFF